MLRCLRQTSLISLLILYAAVVFRPLWPCIDYVVHQEYFAEVLCINKDRPELNCDGKCVLMQKIQAAQQAEQNPEGPLPLQVEDFLSLLYWESEGPAFQESEITGLSVYPEEIGHAGPVFSPPTPPPRS